MKLGDYPLFSSQSRAAARHGLTARRSREGEGILVVLRVAGRSLQADQKCTCPKPPGGTFAICRCFCPSDPPLSEERSL